MTAPHLRRPFWCDLRLDQTKTASPASDVQFKQSQASPGHTASGGGLGGEELPGVHAHATAACERARGRTHRRAPASNFGALPISGLGMSGGGGRSSEGRVAHRGADGATRQTVMLAVEDRVGARSLVLWTAAERAEVEGVHAALPDPYDAESTHEDRGHNGDARQRPHEDRLPPGPPDPASYHDLSGQRAKRGDDAEVDGVVPGCDAAADVYQGHAGGQHQQRRRGGRAGDWRRDLQPDEDGPHDHAPANAAYRSQDAGYEAPLREREGQLAEVQAVLVRRHLLAQCEGIIQAKRTECEAGEDHQQPPLDLAHMEHQVPQEHHHYAEDPDADQLALGIADPCPCLLVVQNHRRLRRGRLQTVRLGLGRLFVQQCHGLRGGGLPLLGLEIQRVRDPLASCVDQDDAERKHQDRGRRHGVEHAADLRARHERGPHEARQLEVDQGSRWCLGMRVVEVVQERRHGPAQQHGLREGGGNLRVKREKHHQQWYKHPATADSCSKRYARNEEAHHAHDDIRHRVREHGVGLAHTLGRTGRVPATVRAGCALHLLAAPQPARATPNCRQNCHVEPQ
mmetsp:Transcript_106314/g.328285  ORF Transcript_106314/g.328285 Transcript_106314/m.328285 type:complete len:570 (+) Transcript_106314:20-1729(+)